MVRQVVSVSNGCASPAGAHVAHSRPVDNNGNDPFWNALLFVLLRNAKLVYVGHFGPLIGIPTHILAL